MDNRFLFTHGDPFNKAQLQSLQRYFDSAFKLSQVVSGYEAFLRFEVCEPLQFFDHWKMTGLTMKEGINTDFLGPSWAEGTPSANYINDCADVVIDQNELFSADVLATLTSLQSYIGSDGPLVYLLWENSD